MKTKQNEETVVSKPSNPEPPQATPLQQHLAAVKTAIEKQSPATRANLAGRFKVG